MRTAPSRPGATCAISASASVLAANQTVRQRAHRTDRPSDRARTARPDRRSAQLGQTICIGHRRGMGRPSLAADPLTDRKPCRSHRRRSRVRRYRPTGRRPDRAEIGQFTRDPHASGQVRDLRPLSISANQRRMACPARGGRELRRGDVVRFENVGLRYGLGPEVLRDLTFRIEPHSFQFLTGPSGAGKTSLLRLLFLSLRPTRGLITLFGHDIATLEQGCAGDAAAAHRHRVPGFSPARPHDHLRERRAAVARDRPERGELIATRWWSCCTGSGSASACGRCRRSCPAARSSAPPSRAP